MVSPALFEGDRLPLARPNGVIEYRGEQHHYIATTAARSVLEPAPAIVWLPFVSGDQWRPPY